MMIRYEFLNEESEKLQIFTKDRVPALCNDPLYHES